MSRSGDILILPDYLTYAYSRKDAPIAPFELSKKRESLNGKVMPKCPALNRVRVSATRDRDVACWPYAISFSGQRARAAKADN